MFTLKLNRDSSVYNKSKVSCVALSIEDRVALHFANDVNLTFSSTCGFMLEANGRKISKSRQRIFDTLYKWAEQENEELRTTVVLAFAAEALQSTDIGPHIFDSDCVKLLLQMLSCNGIFLNRKTITSVLNSCAEIEKLPIVAKCIDPHGRIYAAVDHLNAVAYFSIIGNRERNFAIDLTEVGMALCLEEGFEATNLSGDFLISLLEMFIYIKGAHKQNDEWCVNGFDNSAKTYKIACQSVVPISTVTEDAFKFIA